MNCEACGAPVKMGDFWIRYGERVVTCHACGDTRSAPRSDERQVSPTVFDDTLPGGARWVQNIDHKPLWVETKTELKRELDRRGLRLRDSNLAEKHDKSPWATRTRLR